MRFDIDMACLHMMHEGQKLLHAPKIKYLWKYRVMVIFCMLIISFNKSICFDLLFFVHFFIFCVAHWHPGASIFACKSHAIFFRNTFVGWVTLYFVDFLRQDSSYLKKSVLSKRIHLQATLSF